MYVFKENMYIFRENIPFLLSLLISCIILSSVSSQSTSRHFTPPHVQPLTNLLPHVSVVQSFSQCFGSPNIQFTTNGSSADLVLDKASGAGLVSRNRYQYGFFSAAIKLPTGLSSGVVVAFYLSNADVYPKNHDEIDIELLGHGNKNEWAIQTNIYANGSVRTGREEKFYLWFDPTSQLHHYTILWNDHHILFLVDNIPVREFPRTGAFMSVYPSKPMSVYATIWDGSDWATQGGKYPVNFKYAPFVAKFAEMEMGGCLISNEILSSTNSSSCSKTNGSGLGDPVEGPMFVGLSKEQIMALDWARRKLMFYSYCKDISRYKILPPECK